MYRMRTVLSRCTALFNRRQLDRNLDEQLLAHIELAVEENRRCGMPDVEARTAAMYAGEEGISHAAWITVFF